MHGPRSQQKAGRNGRAQAVSNWPLVNPRKEAAALITRNFGTLRWRKNGLAQQAYEAEKKVRISRKKMASKTASKPTKAAAVPQKSCSCSLLAHSALNTSTTAGSWRQGAHRQSLPNISRPKPKRLPDQPGADLGLPLRSSRPRDHADTLHHTLGRAATPRCFPRLLHLVLIAGLPI